MKHLLTVAFALLGCLPFVASARATQGIDSAYRVTGNPQAAPVQAFSVGSTLYLQLHNVKAVPAPMTTGGQPIPYRIYGPYMLLPVMPQIMLHYGRWTAYVTAAGWSVPDATTATTMRAPLNAADPPPEQFVAPVATTPTVAYVPPIAASNAVTGSISAGGAASQPLRVSAPTSTNAQTVPEDNANAAIASRANRPGGTLMITADGTVAGALAADTAMQQCINLHVACKVRYHGAPAGQIKLETLP